MTVPADLSRLLANQFVVLILDNEVTVGEFVAKPPLAWVRLIQRDDIFQIAEGYPTVLSAEQATFEMRNWDDVSAPAIVHMLRDLERWPDYVIFGNNAGQGLQLARYLPQHWISGRAAIVYASSLPEIDAYKLHGFRTFCRRNETLSHLTELAQRATRPLALVFINTIQHDEFNYHDP